MLMKLHSVISVKIYLLGLPLHLVAPITSSEKYRTTTTAMKINVTFRILAENFVPYITISK